MHYSSISSKRYVLRQISLLAFPFVCQQLGAFADEAQSNPHGGSAPIEEPRETEDQQAIQGLPIIRKISSWVGELLLTSISDC